MDKTEMLTDYQHLNITTPALIFDENVLVENARLINDAGEKAGCVVLYSLKPLTINEILSQLSSYVSGFGVSSLFEARLAKDVSNAGQTIHLTSPGLKKESIDEIADLCDYVNFNSIEQWLRFREHVSGRANCGLRINPQISFVKDQRYDPSRKYSKLGVPVSELIKIYEHDKTVLDGIEGSIIHNNCDSSDFSQILKTVKHIQKKIPFFLESVEWINLGGGYLFDDPDNIEDFNNSVDILKNNYNLTVFIEPGASFVREAGVLVASVVDLFTRDGKDIAVLDTTVNHMTEVFEYQFEPDVYGHCDGAAHSYILAGCSCLAGDIFGEYSFEYPLEVGSRVMFQNMGAYTFVKANTFNGINLPDIYIRSTEGEMQLIKKFTFEDYSHKNGVEKNVYY